MRALGTLAFLAFAAMACFLPARAAHADAKPWIWSWGPDHFYNLDFVPYLEDGTHPQNTQWDRSVWKPNDWIGQRENAAALIRGFYRSDVLKSQEVRDHIPVVVVGPGFYMLGGEDKRRVARTIDQLWHITSAKPDGMFMLYDSLTDEPIGSYTKYGLQIQ